MNEFPEEVLTTSRHYPLRSNLLDRVRATPYALRIQAHVTLLILLCLLWFNLLRLDSLADYRFRSFITSVVFKPPVDTKQDHLASATAKDPAIGSTPLGTKSPSAQGAKGSLVVYVGDCASCTRIDLNLYNNNCKKNGLSLVLLTTGEPKDIKDFLNRLTFRPEVIVDNTGTATKALNTIWLPRTYFLSKDGHLLWLQKTDTYMYDAFKDAAFQRTIAEVKND